MSTTRTLSEQHRHDLDRASAAGEFLVESFVVLIVLAFSAILASAVLRSVAQPGAESCEVAGTR